MDRSDGRTRLLYVDADAGERDLVRDRLAAVDETLEVLTAAGLSAATERVATTSVDCVVTAGTLSDGTGIDLLTSMKERRPDLPVVLAPREGSEALVTEAVAADVDGYWPRSGGDDWEGLVACVLDVIDSPARRQAALDRMTDAFLVLADDWRITYLNDRAREVVSSAMPGGGDATARDLRGEVLWDLVPDAVDTSFYEKYHEAMENQTPVRFEERYDPLDTWFEVRAYPSESGLSVYFQDITERKAYERTLERRETVLSRAVRVLSDKERTFEGKVSALLSIGRTEFGTTYGTLSRLEGEEYVFEVVDGPEASDVAAGDVVPLSWTACERAVATRQRLVIDDMSEAPAEIADREGTQTLDMACYLGVPVIVDDEVYGTLCFYGDRPRDEQFSQWQIALVDLMGSWISYELERDRRERELSRERNRLEDFASMVSHDLRNPLNVATARLELASDECDSPHLADVDEALQRMDELIEDLLALARLGKQVIETETVDLSAVVREAWRTVATGEADLVVEEGIETVVGDSSRLRQLFENLFRNAIEHGSDRPGGGDGGGVTVTVGPLSGEQRQGQGQGQGFYVADDGPGVPPEERDRIFEAGYSTRQDGTGFGLAIVREIAQAHGATVTLVDSETGGARFEIAGIETS